MTTTNDAPAPAPSGSGVRVKPLEWRPAAGDQADRRDIEAPSIVGFYDVLMIHSAYRAVVTLANKVVVIATGLGFEEAKAAAQADYEARILSALASDASPSDGIELAARFVEKRRDDYVQEHGNYDPSTGVTEFPGTGEEYVGELEEIIEGIRSLYAHPAPATVEIVEDPFCPFKIGDVLVCAKPTNFHEVGEVVVVEALSRRYQSDAKPFWVSLIGKPGHYGWSSFRRASSAEIAAALALATGGKDKP